MATTAPSTQAAATTSTRRTPALLVAADQKHRDRRGQRDHRGGMPARIIDSAAISAVNQGLDEGFDQPIRRRNGCRSKDGAVKATGEQAGDDDGCAQRRRRNLRAWRGKPYRQTLMGAEPGNNWRIGSVIEPIRLRLMCEDDAEHGDED